MKVINVMTSKGGSGKTLFATQIAAHSAIAHGLKTAIIDINLRGQQTTTIWHNRRQERAGDTDNLFYALADSSKTVAQKVKQCASHGFDLVVVDTSPDIKEVHNYLASTSDLTLVVLQPIDTCVEGQQDLVAMLDDEQANYVMVINQFNKRFGDHRNTVREIKEAGAFRTLSNPMSHRPTLERCYNGKYVREIGNKDAADEMTALIDEVLTTVEVI